MLAESKHYETEAEWLDKTNKELNGGMNAQNSADSSCVDFSELKQRFDVVKPPSAAIALGTHINDSSAGNDVICKAFEFRESAEKQLSWLDDIRNSLPVGGIQKYQSAGDMKSALKAYEVQ